MSDNIKRISLRIDHATHQDLIEVLADMIKTQHRYVSLHECILNLLDVGIDKYWRK